MARITFKTTSHLDTATPSKVVYPHIDDIEAPAQFSDVTKYSIRAWLGFAHQWSREHLRAASSYTHDPLQVYTSYLIASNILTNVLPNHPDAAELESVEEFKKRREDVRRVIEEEGRKEEVQKLREVFVKDNERSGVRSIGDLRKAAGV